MSTEMEKGVLLKVLSPKELSPQKKRKKKRTSATYPGCREDSGTGKDAYPFRAKKKNRKLTPLITNRASGRGTGARKSRSRKSAKLEGGHPNPQGDIRPANSYVGGGERKRKALPGGPGGMAEGGAGNVGLQAEGGEAPSQKKKQRKKEKSQLYGKDHVGVYENAWGGSKWKKTPGYQRKNSGGRGNTARQRGGWKKRPGKKMGGFHPPAKKKRGGEAGAMNKT